LVCFRAGSIFPRQFADWRARGVATCGSFRIPAVYHGSVFVSKSFQIRLNPTAVSIGAFPAECTVGRELIDPKPKTAMKTFTGFLLGLILGGAAMYFVMSPRARETVKDEAAELKVKAAEKAPDVKAKLEKAGQSAAKAADEARITTAIKAKYAVDPDLSAIQISVNTTEGLVTLSGRVKTPELGEKAVTVAKSVEGVQEVKSTLQPDSERK